jgi:hypothetical protein
VAGAQWVIPLIMRAKQASAEWRVYGTYRIYGTYGIYVVYGILLNVHARQASEFGAACTECGKGYEINKSIKKKRQVLRVPSAEKELIKKKRR